VCLRLCGIFCSYLRFPPYFHFVFNGFYLVMLSN
jgi:hypothetical protein